MQHSVTQDALRYKQNLSTDAVTTTFHNIRVPANCADALAVNVEQNLSEFCNCTQFVRYLSC
jgi:hypothetical protein